MGKDATQALHEDNREDYPWIWELAEPLRERVYSFIEESVTTVKPIKMLEEDGDFSSVIEIDGIVFVVAGEVAYWSANYYDSPTARKDFWLEMDEAIEEAKAEEENEDE